MYILDENVWRCGKMNNPFNSLLAKKHYTPALMHVFLHVNIAIDVASNKNIFAKILFF